MKWTYLVEDLAVPQQTDREELTRQLDALGEDGWEAVAVSATGSSPTGASQYRAILKRRQPEDGSGAVGIPSESDV